MSEELLVRHCSPTLAGMKTANMFVCSFTGEAEMRETLRRFNTKLGKKGLRLLPLRFQDNKALIYVYRPAQLSAICSIVPHAEFSVSAVTAWRHRHAAFSN